jgi:hypothetical protein
MLEIIGIGNEFLNQIPISQEIRTRDDKMDYLKYKASEHQRVQSSA